MIRSLRRRFLLIAMFSLALTLFVIGGSINLGNYIRLTDRADAIITTLYENDWNFPFVRNHPNVSGRFQLTRETEFETRYCIIHLDENEEPSDVNSEHIASLSESDISALTDAILSSGKDNGYWGYYRYHLYPSDGSSESDSGPLVIVDCFSQLQSFYILLRLTFFIIFGCLAVVLLLLLCLSDYVIKPFADNIKKQGGFIPGIRPGKPTSDYLTKILNYIIFIGAVGLVIVAVIPFFFNGVFGANVSFGGTSIIIIVGVILETVKQMESQLLVRNYKGFLN